MPYNKKISLLPIIIPLIYIIFSFFYIMLQLCVACYQWEWEFGNNMPFCTGLCVFVHGLLISPLGQQVNYSLKVAIVMNYLLKKSSWLCLCGWQQLKQTKQRHLFWGRCCFRIAISIHRSSGISWSCFEVNFYLLEKIIFCVLKL